MRERLREDEGTRLGIHGKIAMGKCEIFTKAELHKEK